MGNSSTTAANFPRGKTDEEWKKSLTAEEYKILRQQGTEAAGTGEYDRHYPSEGVYACAGCGQPLYKAETKFKSGCGWPAFYDAIPGAIHRHEDRSWGMKRIEVTCSGCGGHQGHIFEGEGFPTPTDQRLCINSKSMKYMKEGEDKGAK